MRYLKEVSEGETIINSRRRIPMAKLFPFSDPKTQDRPKVGQTTDKRMTISNEALTPIDNDGLKEWGL